MLKNKIALKRIRNIIFLGLVMVIMLGIYNNTIKNSRAEDRVQLTAQMQDKNGLLLNKEVPVEAVKNSDGTYSIELTNLVDGKRVSKYFAGDGTEVTATTGTVLIATADQVVENKISIQLEYDSKQVSNGTNTVAIYNQTLTSNAVTVSGYVPDATTLSAQEIDVATLSEVVLPDSNVTIEKAFDITIANYQPSEYGESVNVAISYNPTSSPIVYHIADDNTVTKIDSVLEGRSVKFTANQFSKYLIATQSSGSTPNTEDTTNTVGNTITNTVTNTVENKVENTVINTVTNTVSNTVANEVTNEVTPDDTQVADTESPVWSKVSSAITETGMDIVIQGTDNASWGYDELTDDKIEVLIDGEIAESISESEIEKNVAEKFVEIEKEIDERIDANQELTDEEKAAQKEQEKTAVKESLRAEEIKNKIIVKLQNKEDIKENEVTIGVKYTVSLSNMEQSSKQIKPETVGTEKEEYKPYVEWSGNVSLKIAAGTLTDVYANVSAETIIEDTEKTDRQTEETADKMFRDIIKPEYTYRMSSTINEGEKTSIIVMFDVVDKYFGESTLKAENITVAIDGIEDANSKVVKTLQKLQDIEETKKEIVKEIVDGVEKQTEKEVTRKIGERYQIKIDNLEEIKIDGQAYTGPIQLIFAEDAQKDTSENGTLAKTITTEIVKKDEIKVMATEGGTLASQITSANYGDYVEYSKDLNGDGDITNDWRIFYKESNDIDGDGANVFIIAADYLPNTWNENSTMTKSTGGYVTYGAYWSSPSSLGLSLDASNKYMISKAGTFTSTNASYQATASLLTTSYWTNLVDSTVAETAIGSPTVEMWMSSWNEIYPSDMLYCNNADSTGYYVGTTTNPTDTYIDSEVMSAKAGYNNTLFYPDQTYDNLDGTEAGYFYDYWLASPSANFPRSVLSVYYDGGVNSYFYDSRRLALRPVVSLKSNIVGTQDAEGVWTLTEQANIFVDFEAPVWKKSSSSIDRTNEIVKVTLQGTDKNLDKDNSALAKDKITVYTQNTSTGVYEANENISKDLSTVKDIENGIEYTLTLGNFGTYEGKVAITVTAETLADTYGNKNSALEQIGVGNETAVAAFSEDIVDFVKPEIEYNKSATVLDKTNKKLIVEFDVTDSYCNFDFTAGTTFTASDILVKIDGDEGADEALTNALSKTLTKKADITEVVNGESKKVGETYRLEISNLDQIDYSGPVNLVLAGNVVKDTSGNANVQKTITVTASDSEDEIMVDFLTPVLKTDSVNIDFNYPADAATKDATTLVGTATAKLIGSDKYFDADYFAANPIEASDLVVFVDGVETTEGITLELLSQKPLTKATADGTGTYTYGLELEVKVSGFTASAKQVRVGLKANTVQDTNGNGNTLEDYTEACVIYNTLKSTATENSETSAFLGNTSIKRNTVTKVIFESNLDNINKDKSWNVASQGDSSIVAWLDANDNTIVHIGSENPIHANSDSTDLFYGLTKATAIENIDILNTKNVTNMRGMFELCGQTAMTSLDLGNNFYTKNVTSMEEMFYQAGYRYMTTLNLGDNFDTANVTNMRYMFYACGAGSLTELDLKDKFDVRNVTDMTYMFRALGTTAMTHLDLGPMFTKLTSNCGLNQEVGKNASDETVIDVPEAIYYNETGFKQNADTSVRLLSYTRGTLNPKYYTVWEESSVSFSDDVLTVVLDGATNENYTANFGENKENVTAPDGTVSTRDRLDSSDITVYADGTQVNGLTVNVGEANRTVDANGNTTAIDYTIQVSGFKAANISGDISLGIAAKTLRDEYGNSNLAYEVKDENGAMFIETVAPEITYDSSTFNVEHQDKKITVYFTISDNYEMKSIAGVTDIQSAEAIEALKNAINVILEGEGSTATKTLSVEEVLTNGEKTLGARYKLVLSDFGQYYGTVSITFPDEIAVDKYDNKSIGKTISVANGDIIDFQNPVWEENATVVINRTRDGKPADTVDITFRGLDKEIDEAASTFADASAIEVWVAGTKIDTISKVFASQTAITEEGETKPSAMEYKLTLGNFGANSGEVVIKIPTNTLFDESGLTAEPKEYTIGMVDFIKPVIENISSRLVDVDTVEYTFTVTEKYLATDYQLKPEDINVFVDEEDVSSEVTRTLNIASEDANGKTYTFTITKFKENDLSGTVYITIPEGKVKDSSGNVNSAITRAEGQFVDNILPEITYKYAALTNPDIDKAANTLTVIFNATDKHFDYSATTWLGTVTNGVAITGEALQTAITNAEDATKKNIQITIDGQDITDKLTSITPTKIDGGMNYTFLVEGLEEDVITGDYKDYSGVVQVSIAAGFAQDTNANKTLAKNITIADAQDKPIIVDVIDPIWNEDADITINQQAGTVDITFIGTDKYIDKTASTFDASTIEVYVGGTKVNSIQKSFKEIKALTANGETSPYGVQYTLTLSKFGTNTGDLKIVVPANVLKDTNGLVCTTSKTYEFADSLVDFVKPEWAKTDSSINRTNKTVDVALQATDNVEINSCTLTNENIANKVKVYVMNASGSYEENTTITKSLAVAPTVADGKATCIVRLSNFGDKFEGKVAIEVLEGTVLDSSNNGNEKTEKIGVGNINWVDFPLSAVTNDNIGDYIDLGNDIIDFNGTTDVTTDDWRIFYAEDTNEDGKADIVHVILADYFPNNTTKADGKTYVEGAELNALLDYVVYSSPSAEKSGILIRKLTTSSYWNELANGLTDATVIGTPTAELLINSYNEKNETNIDIESINDLYELENKNDLYVPHTEVFKYCDGYWLASEASIGAVGYLWTISYESEFSAYYYDQKDCAIRPVVSIPVAQNANLQVIRDDTKYTAFRSDIVDFTKPEITYQYTDEDISTSAKTLTVNFDIEDKYFLESVLADSTVADGSEIDSEIVNDNITIKIDGTETENATANSTLTKKLIKVDDKASAVDGVSQKTGEKYQLVISGFETIDYSGPVQIIIDGGVATDSSGNSTDPKTITVGINEPEGEGTEEVVDVIEPVIEKLSSVINRTRDGAEEDSVEVVLKGSDKYLTECKITSANIGNYIKVYTENASGTYVQNNSITKTLVGTPTVANREVEIKVKLTNFGTYSGKVAIEVQANAILDRYGNGNKKTDKIGVGQVDWKENGDTTQKYKAFSQDIVDFIKPEWAMTENTPNEAANTVTVTLEGTDKYLQSCEITTENVANYIKVYEKNTAGTYVENTDVAVTLAANPSITNGKTTLTLTLSGFDTVSGEIAIEVLENSLFDSSGNTNDTTEKFEIGYIDFIKPVFEIVDSNLTDPDTVTYEIRLTEKHLPNGFALSADDFVIYVDSEDVSDTVTKTLSITSEDENGKTYLLTITKFNENDLSGTVYLEIPEGIVEDKAGKVNDGIAKADGEGPFVDSILPEFTYKYSTISGGDDIDNPEIDATANTLTVIFDVTDKHLSTVNLQASALRIAIDGEDLTDKLTLSFASGDPKTIANGKRYTLLVEGLESADESGKYKEYSGPVSITIPAGVAKDSNNNSSVSKTITVDYAEGDGDNPIIVDVVEPVWEDDFDVVINRTRDGADIDSVDITFRGTDKYIDVDTMEETFSVDDIIVAVDGTNDSEAVLNIEKEFIETTTSKEDGQEYEIKYTLRLTNFGSLSGDLDITIPGGTLIDLAGLTNLNPAEYSIGIVDFIKPEWEKVSSSISRIRDGASENAVEVVFKGSDKDLQNCTLTNSNIANNVKVYVMNDAGTYVENTTIKKNLVSLSNVENEEVTATIKLNNFADDFEGKVAIEILKDTLSDSSGNKNEATGKVGVGDLSWVEVIERSGGTLESVTNDNIGEYIDLGNDIVDYNGTTDVTTDDWRIFYVEDTDEDGTADIVHVILAEYFPNATTKADGTTYVAGAGLDTYGTLAVRSSTRDLLVSGLTTQEYWKELANGIGGATVIGTPTAELLMNSYNAKNGTNLIYTSKPELSNSTEDYDLYVSTELEYFYGYWLATPFDFDSPYDKHDGVYYLNDKGKIYSYYYHHFEMGIRPVVSLPINTKAELVNGVWKVDNSAKYPAFRSDIVDYAKPVISYTYSESDISTENNSLTVNFDIEDKYFSNSTLAESNIKVKIDDGTGNFVENETLSNADNIVLTKVEDITKTVDGVSQKTGERYELVISGFESIDYSGTVQIAIDGGVVTDTSGNTTDPKTITVGIDEPSGEGDAEIVDVIEPVWEKIDSSINRTRDGASEDSVEVVLKGTDKYLDKVNLKASNIGTYIKVYTQNSSDEYVENTSITKTLTDITSVENGEVTATIKLTNFGTYSGKVAIEVQEYAIVDESGNGNETTEKIGVGNVEWVEISDNPENVSWKIFYKESADANGDGTNVFLIASDFAPNTLIQNPEITKSEDDAYTVYWEFDNLKTTTIDNEIAKKYMFSLETDYDTLIYTYQATASLLTPDYWSNFKDETYADSAIGTPTLEMWFASWNEIYPDDKLYWADSSPYGYLLAKDPEEFSSLPYAGTLTGSVMMSKEGFNNKLFYPREPYQYSDGSYLDMNKRAYWIASPQHYPRNSFSGLVWVTSTGGIGANNGNIDGYNNMCKKERGIRPVVSLKSDVKATKNPATGIWELSTTSGNTLSSQITASNYGDYINYPIKMVSVKYDAFREDIVDFIKPTWKAGTLSKDVDAQTLTIPVIGTDKFFLENTLTADDITIYTKNSAGNYVVSDKGIKCTLGTPSSTTDGEKTGVQINVVLSNFGDYEGDVAIGIAANTLVDTSGNMNDATSPTSPMHAGFTDWVVPQISYKYSSTDIDYDAKTLTVDFSITDNYFASSKITDCINSASSSNKETIDGLTFAKFTGTSLIGIAVDGATEADSKVTKKIAKVEDVYATVEGTSKKVGEKYRLIISGLENIDIRNAEGNYVEYSGPVNITLVAGIASDESSNGTLKTTLTVGIDEPSGEGEEEIVDVVDPIWDKTDSSIKRARDGYTGAEADTVEVTIAGTDKYLNKAGCTTLAKSHITIYKDDVAVSDTVRDTLIKSITAVAGTDDQTIQYKVVLGNFGDFSGKVHIQLAEGILVDQFGNKNKATDKIEVGNVSWIEDNEPIINLSKVTNSNIGDYIDLGNDIVEWNGTKGDTTDDWRIFYAEDSNEDGKTDVVHVILSDYFPNSTTVPAGVTLTDGTISDGTTTYLKNASLTKDSRDGYIYSVNYTLEGSSGRDNLLGAASENYGLLSETAWSGLTNGINGAIATGSPTADLLQLSYRANNVGTFDDFDYTVDKLSDSSNDYDLYAPHLGEEEHCWRLLVGYT